MSSEMNGAESLVRTLIAGDVTVCFTNPGTSEMHFVAALDKVPGMRCVLGLFEGVVTGAADGYYRMLDKPASTLLHLGPGLANGLANLHNAKKASSGIVNIVGEHATYHITYDAPLTSDIEGVARPMSHWVKTSPTSAGIAADGALAIEAARQTPGQIATLILPADTAWGPANSIAETAPRTAPPKVSSDAVKAAAKMLRESPKATLLMGGAALRARPLELAGRIAAKTGCGILTEGANTRLERGAGRVQVNRIPYVVDQALKVMEGAGNLVLVGAREPVAFFAYPNKPSLLKHRTRARPSLPASKMTWRRHSKPLPSSSMRSTRSRPALQHRADPLCRQGQLVRRALPRSSAQRFQRTPSWSTRA
jgi:acetolactate synthase-1/2/3 large subunit